MTWAETIVQSLKNWNTSLIAYVPDISIHRVTSLIEKDPYFHLVSAAREEEAIGMKDETCPYRTVIPVFERIPGPKAIHVYPELAHSLCTDFNAHLMSWLRTGIWGLETL